MSCHGRASGALDPMITIERGREGSSSCGTASSALDLMEIEKEGGRGRGGEKETYLVGRRSRRCRLDGDKRF